MTVTVNGDGIPVEDLHSFAMGRARRTVAMLDESRKAADAFHAVARLFWPEQGRFGRTFTPAQFEAFRVLSLDGPEGGAHPVRVDQLAQAAVLIDEYQRANGRRGFSHEELSVAYNRNPELIPFSRLRKLELTPNEGLELIRRLVRVESLSADVGRRAITFFRNGPSIRFAGPAPRRMTQRYLRSFRPPDAPEGAALTREERRRRSIVGQAVRAMSQACPDAVPSPFEFNPLSYRPATGADLANFPLSDAYEGSDDIAWRYAEAATMGLATTSHRWEDEVLSDQILIDAWRSIELLDETPEQKKLLKTRFVDIADRLSAAYPDRAPSIMNLRMLPDDLPPNPTGQMLLAATYNYHLIDIDKFPYEEIEKMRTGVNTAVKALNEKRHKSEFDVFSTFEEPDILWLTGNLSYSSARRFNSALMLYLLVRHEQTQGRVSTMGGSRLRPPAAEADTDEPTMVQPLSLEPREGGFLDR